MTALDGLKVIGLSRVLAGPFLRANLGRPRRAGDQSQRPRRRGQTGSLQGRQVRPATAEPPARRQRTIGRGVDLLQRHRQNPPTWRVQRPGVGSSRSPCAAGRDTIGDDAPAQAPARTRPDQEDHAYLSVLPAACGSRRHRRCLLTHVLQHRSCDGCCTLKFLNKYHNSSV